MEPTDVERQLGSAHWTPLQAEEQRQREEAERDRLGPGLLEDKKRPPLEEQQRLVQAQHGLRQRLASLAGTD